MATFSASSGVGCYPGHAIADSMEIQGQKGRSNLHLRFKAADRYCFSELGERLMLRAAGCSTAGVLSIDRMNCESGSGLNGVEPPDLYSKQLEVGNSLRSEVWGGK